jgi:hypothetical protein
VFVAVAEGPRTLRRSEIDAHGKDAIEEVIPKYGVDPSDRTRAREALKKAFGLEDSGFRSLYRSPEVDVGKVERSLAEIFKSASSKASGPITLTAPAPGHEGSATWLRGPRLVPSVFSAIRRRSIVEEIGPGTSQQLDRASLGRYLKDTLNVPDYPEVMDSFDIAQNVEVVTLKRDTTLLRLCGGVSEPIGRYYFCCLWSSEGQSRETRWSDASGLALPPGNLRDHLAAVTIPAGTNVIVGTVADNFANRLGMLSKGGNTQIFVSEVKTPSFQEYRISRSGPSASDIVVLSDDRIVRFRPKADK